MITPKHIKKTIPNNSRIIVISDIHGHLDLFKRLLKKVNYTSEDYLVILGDFVEKGDQVIDTIHYIKQLSKLDRVFVLTGNCEWAVDAFLTVPELAKQIPIYFERVLQNGCIREVYHKLHLDDGSETILGIQKRIAEYLEDELKFISHLPVTLQLNQFLFVHAGVEKNKDYQDSSLSSLLEMKYFHNLGHDLNYTVIVGHMPTSNYHQSHICNDIMIDEDKKIISIDGGVGVKFISQLNALIINLDNDKIVYECESVMGYPIYKVTKDITHPKKEVHKIGYPYFEIEVLEKGAEFSTCVQKDTNQYLEVKNEFIYQKDNQTYCLDDYTDHKISAKKNDLVSLIDFYGQYAYVMCKKQVGWIEKEDIKKQE